MKYPAEAHPKPFPHIERIEACIRRLGATLAVQHSKTDGFGLASAGYCTLAVVEAAHITTLRPMSFWEGICASLAGVLERAGPVGRSLPPRRSLRGVM
jgi:hypothetical protein